MTTTRRRNVVKSYKSYYEDEEDDDEEYDDYSAPNDRRRRPTSRAKPRTKATTSRRRRKRRSNFSDDYEYDDDDHHIDDHDDEEVEDDETDDTSYHTRAKIVTSANNNNNNNNGNNRRNLRHAQPKASYAEVDEDDFDEEDGEENFNQQPKRKIPTTRGSGSSHQSKKVQKMQKEEIENENDDDEEAEELVLDYDDDEKKKKEEHEENDDDDDEGHEHVHGEDDDDDDDNMATTPNKIRTTKSRKRPETNRSPFMTTNKATRGSSSSSSSSTRSSPPSVMQSPYASSRPTRQKKPVNYKDMEDGHFDELLSMTTPNRSRRSAAVSASSSSSVSSVSSALSAAQSVYNTRRRSVNFVEELNSVAVVGSSSGSGSGSSSRGVEQSLSPPKKRSRIMSPPDDHETGSITTTKTTTPEGMANVSSSTPQQMNGEATRSHIKETPTETGNYRAEEAATATVQKSTSNTTGNRPLLNNHNQRGYLMGMEVDEMMEDPILAHIPSPYRKPPSPYDQNKSQSVMEGGNQREMTLTDNNGQLSEVVTGANDVSNRRTETTEQETSAGDVSTNGTEKPATDMAEGAEGAEGAEDDVITSKEVVSTRSTSSRKKNNHDSDGEYEPNADEGEEEDDAHREEDETMDDLEQSVEHEEMENDEEEDDEVEVVRARRARQVTHKRLSYSEQTSRYSSRRNRSTRRRVQALDYTDDEDEDDEGEYSGDATIKTRLRPRNKKQVNPYTHVPEEVTPSKQARESSRYDELQAKFSRQRKQQTPPANTTPIRPVPVPPSPTVNLDSSSSSDSSDDEPPTGQMNAGAKNAIASSTKYSHIAPINLHELQGNKNKPSADIDPMKVGNVGWDQIGGLQHHVDALKEMVVLPLLYPEVFQKFDITPPRGVIFFGLPGTGKTLVARALANSCSGGAKPIAFFMRKGADILSKWVGEAEKQLRLLFDEAKRLQPSIIFFDEIDGLAPVRSSKQDYIHSSIVSTLLALMDGLDNRGQVVVIGATNRIDSIDPALRRPGRFDRELVFTLPSKNARKEIFTIHTRSWQPPVPPGLAEDIARRSVGYCGADIKALCAEAALCALKRKYPQVYSSSARLLIDINSVEVQKIDFLDAMKGITPASHRSAIVHARPLPAHLTPLLSDKLEMIKDLVRKVFPIACKFLDRHDEVVPSSRNSEENAMDTELDGYTEFSEISFMDHGASDFMVNPPSYRPWILLYGDEGMGQLTLGRALLYALEEVPLFSLDFASLITNPNVRSAEEALINTFAEARKSSPSILWLPNIHEWWNRSSEVLQSTLCSMLQDLPSSLNVLVLATAGCCKSLSQLPLPLQSLFSEHHCLIKAPTTDQRKQMFSVFRSDVLRKPIVKHKKRNTQTFPELPLAPQPVEEVKQSEHEQEKKRKDEDAVINELRIRLRDIMLHLLTNKRFEVFMKPPKPSQLHIGSSDQDEPSTHHLIYLYDILENLEQEKYSTLKSFYRDLKQIIRDHALYQLNGDAYTVKRNFSKAKQIYEVITSAVRTSITKDIIKQCKTIAKNREAEERKKRESEVAASSTTETTVGSADVEANDANNPIEIDVDQEVSASTTTTGSPSSVMPSQEEAATHQEQQPTSSDVSPTVQQEQAPQTSSMPNGDVESESTTATTADNTTNALESGENNNQPATTAESVNGSPAITPVSAETEPVVPDVVIDKDRLELWFDSFLSLTEGCPVEQLDRHFSVLYKMLYKYRFTHERSEIVTELEQYSKEIDVIEHNT